MQSTKTGFQSIDAYIATFPEEIQVLLQTVRATIHEAAPDAIEAISYQMPTFVQNGNIVHFAAWKSHIGLYPAPHGLEAFAQELSKYESSKGAVRFPINEPLPLELIRKIVQYRVAENRTKAAAKATKRKG